MSDRLDAWLFVRVCARRQLLACRAPVRLSQPSASRIVGRLEKEIGASLFTRSHTRARIDRSGRRVPRAGEPALAALDDADHAARGTGELRGRMRGRLVQLYRACGDSEAGRFLKQHPKLRLVLLISDQRQALITEGWTSPSVSGRSAIRPPPRAGWAASGACSSHRRPTCAGRAARRFPPISIRTSSSSDRWRQSAGPSRRMGARVSLRPEGRIVVSANEGAVAAAVAGLGIASRASSRPSSAREPHPRSTPARLGDGLG